MLCSRCGFDKPIFRAGWCEPCYNGDLTSLARPLQARSGMIIIGNPIRESLTAAFKSHRADDIKYEWPHSHGPTIEYDGGEHSTEISMGAFWWLAGFWWFVGSIVIAILTVILALFLDYHELHSAAPSNNSRLILTVLLIGAALTIWLAAEKRNRKNRR